VPSLECSANALGLCLDALINRCSKESTLPSTGTNNSGKEYLTLFSLQIIIIDQNLRGKCVALKWTAILLMKCSIYVSNSRKCQEMKNYSVLLRPLLILLYYICFVKTDSRNSLNDWYDLTQGISYPVKPDRNHKRVEELKPEDFERHINHTIVQQLIAKNHDPFREQNLLNILKNVSGVYKDKSKAKKMGLEKTVFISIIEYDTAHSIQYKVYFQNFMCYAQTYNYDILIYLLYNNKDVDVSNEVAKLEQRGAHVISYPVELFWQLIDTKPSIIYYPQQKEHADYHSKHPNFVNFGALVMIVPGLEILQYGYNFIYFDLDIALVQDPIPYLLQGDADFITTTEFRYCPEIYPSVIGAKFDWNSSIEANTGIMHVRATEQGLRLYKTWILHMIDLNLINDQRALKFWNFNASYTPNCNWNLSDFPSEKKYFHNEAKYCYLSEILFQNGLIGLQCSQKPSFRDDWYHAMWTGGSSTFAPIGKELLDKYGYDKRYPVALHVNYCNKKSYELKLRGLWLLNDTAYEHDHKYDRCIELNISSTWYTTIPMEENYKRINDYRTQILADLLKNGTLVKRRTANEIYRIDENNLKHLIPDADTFLSLGYEWSQVNVIPAAILFAIENGVPLESIKQKIKLSHF